MTGPFVANIVVKVVGESIIQNIIFAQSNPGHWKRRSYGIKFL